MTTQFKQVVTTSLIKKNNFRIDKFQDILQELDEFCDKQFANDTEIENYCREKHISTNEEG